jgi:hypothetical protein
VAGGWSLSQRYSLAILPGDGSPLSSDLIISKYFDLKNRELISAYCLLEARSDASSPSFARRTPECCCGLRVLPTLLQEFTHANVFITPSLQSHFPAAKVAAHSGRNQRRRAHGRHLGKLEIALLLRCGRTLPRHCLLDPPLNVDSSLFPCHISLLCLITWESFLLASYAINKSGELVDPIFSNCFDAANHTGASLARGHSIPESDGD